MCLIVISQGKADTTTCLNHPSDQDEYIPCLFSLFRLFKIIKIIFTSVSGNSENVHLDGSSNKIRERLVQIKVKRITKKNPIIVNFLSYSGTN